MEAVHLVGVGGIGTVVGYALAAAGVPVVCVERSPAKLAAGRRYGLQVAGRPAVPATFLPFEQWQPPPGATVLLCTKCYDNPAVLARLPAAVQLVPIQNGFDPHLEAFPHEYEGIVAFVAAGEPDRPAARITRPGPLYLGRYRSGNHPSCRDDGPSPRSASLPSVPLPSLPPLPPPLEPLRRNSLFRLRLVKDIAPLKATKLLYNAAISPLAAPAGLDNAALLSHPPARRLFFALLAENDRILRAAGVRLGWLGPLPPRGVTWVLRRRWLAERLARWLEPSLRGTYCSMAGEIARGRTEIEQYTGHLLRLARQAGVAAPLNAAIYELVQEMTRRRAAPDPAVIDRLLVVLQRQRLAEGPSPQEHSPIAEEPSPQEHSAPAEPGSEDRFAPEARSPAARGETPPPDALAPPHTPDPRPLAVPPAAAGRG